MARNEEITITYTAWDVQNNQAKTGDAAKSESKKTGDSKKKKSSGSD